MTWNTPLGERTLDVPEQYFFKTAMRKMSKLLIELAAEDSIETGVPIFDSLTGCQQLVMLDYIRRYLFEETEELNPATANVEGTAGAVISFVRREIAYELDTDREVALAPTIEPRKRWRKLLHRIFKPYEWRINSRLRIKDWHSVLDLFHDRILYNNDYLFDFNGHADDAEEIASQSRAVPDDYYVEIAQREPNGSEMLELVRRLIA
jgi:hypothetical protein